MICEVNNEPTPAHWISYAELGFNGPVELPVYPYTLRYDFNELRDLIALDADDFVLAMKQDYEQTGDTYPQYLHDLGYPLIDVLAQHEDAFCETIKTWLHSELLGHCFPWKHPYEEVRWVICSVDTVRCRGGSVEVLGQAFRKVEQGSSR
ncbi:unnamed protein product [Tuwongella immobilis]|uniref:Uncharacterized protein n=1 Tax=Tuwongella immobilis TaxID=692036 RepID=A0A6C2YHS7_9BACT|nr:unnamed protein product [Tuwongella immobilis]VTR97040.1 unnamed protein product [Tuwongella immobilis]